MGRGNPSEEGLPPPQTRPLSLLKAFVLFDGGAGGLGGCFLMGVSRRLVEREHFGIAGTLPASFSKNTPFASPPHQSKVLGRWGSGGGGRKALLQKVFPPSFPGMSRLPTLHPATALPRKGSKTRSPRSPRNGWAALRQPQAADRTTPSPFPRCPRRQQRPRR